MFELPQLDLTKNNRRVMVSGAQSGSALAITSAGPPPWS